MFNRVGIFAFAAAILFSSTAAAQDCALKEYASLNMVTLPSGEIAIPLKVGGVEKNFVVKLNSAKSAINDDLADALKLQRSPASITPVIFLHMPFYPTGSRSDQVTVAVNEGSVTIGDFSFLVTSGAQSINTSGYLGLDFFRHFEVEIDFRTAKLNLFSQDHCLGKLVYWADSGAGIAPFYYTPYGQIVFTAKLDGVMVLTRLTTDPGSGRMAMETAGKLLDVRMKSPNLVPAGTDSDGQLYYRYPFKTLEIGDVTIENPTIDLHLSMNDCDGLHTWSKKAVDLNLCGTYFGLLTGLDELRPLHLFFSFKEAKLYLTAGAAHR